MPAFNTATVSGKTFTHLRSSFCPFSPFLSIHSFNDIYYPILFCGILAAGGIFAGTNPAYTRYELVHTLKTAKVQYVIVEPELLGPMQAAMAECGIPESSTIVFHPLAEQKCPEGMTSWLDLMKHGERDWPRFNDADTCKTTVAARLFSSGTTGLPKALLNTHQNFIAQHELVYEGANHKPYDIVNLYPLPMFHAAVAPRAHTSVFKAGWKTYIMRKFDLELFLQGVERFGVTDIGLVPAMTIAAIMSPASKKYSLKSVKHAASGAAPLDEQLQSRFQELLPPTTPFTQVWGMTETTCTATHIPYPGTDTTGSVGRPIPNIDLKLVDDSGADISAYDVRGELCVRGPTVILGYFENDQANAESFDSDGFYHTGDIAYCASATRFWYIVDRKKELIKVRSFQVAPPELEATIMAHPDVLDAAVIGVIAPEARDGELPRAYVVRKAGSRLGEEEVKKFAGERLASFKRLHGGVVFVDAIPKNASGKILKRILRERAKKELGERAVAAKL